MQKHTKRMTKPDSRQLSCKICWSVCEWAM